MVSRRQLGRVGRHQRSRPDRPVRPPRRRDAQDGSGLSCGSGVHELRVETAFGTVSCGPQNPAPPTPDSRRNGVEEAGLRRVLVPFTAQVAGRTAIAFVAGLMLADAVPAAAQPLTSRVEGTVQDETGAVVPGASVTMTQVDTGVARATITDDRGLYLFPRIPAGAYRVEASAAGFTTTVVEEVRVALNAPTSVDIVIEVGAVAETVVVAAAGPQSLLNTANAELNTNLMREQVRDLPLNGRDVTQLALTQAGVTGPAGARTASINGTRGTFNNFTLDGVNNQDAFIRTDALFGEIPVKESFIEEISITTGNADVDDGLGASQTHFVTRSGGNSFDTEVFFHHRNEAFNATNFFNKAAGIEKERGAGPRARLQRGRSHRQGQGVLLPQLRRRARARYVVRRAARPDGCGAPGRLQLRPAGQRPGGHREPVQHDRHRSRSGHPVTGRVDPGTQRLQRGRRTEHGRAPVQQSRRHRFPLVGVPGRLRAEPAAFGAGIVSSLPPGHAELRVQQHRFRFPGPAGRGPGLAAQSRVHRLYELARQQRPA